MSVSCSSKTAGNNNTHTIWEIVVALENLILFIIFSLSLPVNIIIVIRIIWFYVHFFCLLYRIDFSFATLNMLNIVIFRLALLILLSHFPQPFELVFSKLLHMIFFSLLSLSFSQTFSLFFCSGAIVWFWFYVLVYTK